MIASVLIEKLELSPDRELDARFTALGFSAPDRVRIQYRLEGHDREWIELRHEQIEVPVALHVQRQDIGVHGVVDLERMVLRDKSLPGKSTPVVRKAFENYDLTFLVHASVENDRALKDQWLDEVEDKTITFYPDNPRSWRRIVCLGSPSL